MVRYLAAAVLLAGCDPITAESHPIISDPDAGQCELGAFTIDAPRPGEHYDKALDVLVDETELWGELSVTITDDAGDSYMPTAESTLVDPAHAINHDTYAFELAAGTRYMLAVSHCTTYQSVAFFTSP